MYLPEYYEYYEPIPIKKTKLGTVVIWLTHEISQESRAFSYRRKAVVSAN